MSNFIKEITKKEPDFYKNKITSLFKYLTETKDKFHKERLLSLGSVLGAFCGDSMGSYYEFKLGSDVLYDSLKLFEVTNPIFQTLPGQFTDDSELAMSSAYGILDSNGDYNNNKVAYYNGLWLLSGPFDVGITTRNSVVAVRDFKIYEKIKPEYYNWVKTAEIIKENFLYFPNNVYSDAMSKCSVEKNADSLSNGFLMKKTPISIFSLNFLKSSISDKDECHIKNMEAFEKINILDCNLTHPHGLANDISIIYSLIITRIIFFKNRDFQDKDIIENVLNYLKTYVTNLIEKIVNLVLEKFKNYDLDSKSSEVPILKAKLHYFTDLLLQIEKGESKIILEGQFLNLMGYFAKAFYLVFYYLHKLKDSDINTIDYYEIMKEIINRGGDTDTNCAIVGGVLGIFYGPVYLKEDKRGLFDYIINCDATTSKKERPLIYSPGMALFFMYAFYKIRERDLNKNVEVLSETSLPVSAAVIACLLTVSDINEVIFDL